MMLHIPVKFYREILGQTVCDTTRDFGITILSMRVSFLADQLLRIFFYFFNFLTNIDVAFVYFLGRKMNAGDVDFALRTSNRFIQQRNKEISIFA